jgi:hypothetical protein
MADHLRTELVLDADAELADQQLAQARQDLSIEPIAVRLHGHGRQLGQARVPSIGQRRHPAVGADPAVGAERRTVTQRRLERAPRRPW